MYNNIKKIVWEERKVKKGVYMCVRIEEAWIFSVKN